MKRSPILRKTPLARAGGLRPFSRKRARENRERRRIADAMQADGPVLCAWPGSPHYADDLHEIKSRAQGGSVIDPANLAPLCRLHHDQLTHDPDWRKHAIALGLVITRKDGAA